MGCGKGELGLDFAVILAEDFDAGAAELEDVTSQLVVLVQQVASMSLSRIANVTDFS